MNDNLWMREHQSMRAHPSPVHNGNTHNGHQPMNISRFFGSTNREAMRQVRMALGSEALIVSNRRVNGGVEILAADASSAATPHAVNIAGAAPITMTAATANHTVGLPPATEHPAMLMDAITALRGEMEHRMEDLVWNQQIKQAPQALSLFQTLLGLGFSTALLKPMLKHLPSRLSEKAALSWARQELIRRLPPGADEDVLWRPGLALALIGPTGVGKTTTLAKLAARAVRRFGPQRVVLLTTDTYRIGACEQLNIYGQILRTPVHVAHDAGELQRIVRDLPADHILLIDSVGVSQRDSAVKAQAAMLRAAGRDVQRLLVLNAASHGDTLDDVARTYRHDGGAPLAGCIVSKLDEALRLAPVLDTAIRHQLPIHYVSDGQKVPEHLSHLSAQELVDKALMHAASADTLYAPNRADLAALMTLADGEVAAQEDARLLTGLLVASHGAQRPLTPDLVRQACREIDAHSACAHAFRLWQARHRAQALDHEDLAHASCTGNTDRQDVPPALLVIAHDHATVATTRHGPDGQQGRNQRPAQGRLCWGQIHRLAHDGFYTPLSSPVQSLQQAHAWMSSCGASALGTEDATQTRLRQVRWFAAQAPDLTRLHVFDGGTPRLWRALLELDAAWATSCAPGTMVVHQDTLTRASALANHATYRVLDTTSWHHSLQTCMDRPLADLTVGFAADAVTLRVRPGKQDGHSLRQTGVPLRLIHLRLQDRRDGSLMRQWSVLSHIDPALLSDTALAQILLVRHTQASMARIVQACWRLFTQPDAQMSRQDTDSGAWQAQATLAVHTALAAWCIQQSGQTPIARQVLASLCASANPTANATASGMLRLFALKDMLRDQG